MFVNMVKWGTLVHLRRFGCSPDDPESGPLTGHSYGIAAKPEHVGIQFSSVPAIPSGPDHGISFG